MKTNLKSNSRSNSLSKLNEEVDKLISSEKKKKHLDENHTFLSNILGDEEDFNYQIPCDIDKKILEMAERRDFDLANSKKYKSKKIGLDLLNEQLDNLIKKTINESKADTGGNDSPSKNSQNKQCKKKLVKHKIDYDEDYRADPGR
jgi:replication-associated recombination protein RarA